MEKGSLEDFIQQFHLPRNGFTKAVPFSDVFGFSTSKPRIQNGFNFESLYKFYIRTEDLKKDSQKKSISIVVSYGERMPNGGIRLSPTSVSRKSSWPIDFASTDEFYFDTTTGEFSRENLGISAKDILQMVENLHMRPTKLFSGIFLRAKFLFRTFFTNVLKSFYDVQIYALWGLFGSWTTKSIWLIDDRRDAPGLDKKINPDSFAAQKINIFGYSASAWPVVTYSIVHLAIYGYWYFSGIEKYSFISSIFSNNFLTILYVIPSLVFYEKLLPNVLEGTIRRTGEAFHKVAFAQIKLDL